MSLTSLERYAPLHASEWLETRGAEFSVGDTSAHTVSMTSASRRHTFFVPDTNSTVPPLRRRHFLGGHDVFEPTRNNLFGVITSTAINVPNENLPPSLAPLSGASAKAKRAAAQVLKSLSLSVLAFPTIVEGDGEIVVQWVDQNSHAFISIDESGDIAYAYLQNGTFVPGEVLAEPGELPNDLVEYLLRQRGYARRVSV